MINLNLQAVPNQEFTATLDGNVWDIILKSCGGITTTTISINNILMTTNLLCTANTPLLPYPYMEEMGNLIFITNNDELPDYSLFGSSQNLIYASAAEMAAL